MNHRLIAACLVLLTAGAAAGSMTKYKITTRVDEHTDFSRLRTYVWDMGAGANDRETHERIVAAIDRELAALRFTKGAAGKSDVIVEYTAVRRTDVNFKSKTRGPHGERATFPVATLIVALREPVTRRELFSARAMTPIRLESQALEVIIDSQVAQIFERYPTRHPSPR